LNNEPSENICVNSSFDGILSILQKGFLCISALLFVQTYHDRFVKQYEKSIARMTVKYIENMEWADGCCCGGGGGDGVGGSGGGRGGG
jgi:uncharacterized membrane protein